MPNNELTTMLKTSPALPPAALRAIFAIARAEPVDTPSLAALAGREDTPTDVLDELAAMPATSIRAALGGRVRQSETRVPETNATVLASALKGRTQHPWVIEDAIAAYLTKPTAALAPLVSRMPPQRFTPEEALTILQNTRVHTKEGVSHQTRSLIARLGPKLAASLSGSREHMWLIPHVLRFELPMEMTLRMLKDLAQLSTPTSTAYLESALAAALRSRTTEDRELINEKITSYTRHRKASATYAVTATIKRSMPYETVAPLRWDDRPAERPQPAQNVADLPWEAQEALAASPDPQVLHDVVASAIKHGYYSWISGTANVAFRNRALAVADRHALLEALIEDPHGQPWKDLADVDIVALYPDDEYAVRTWCEFVPEQVLPRHGWGPFGGLEAAPAVLAAWQADTDAERVATRLRILSTTAVTVEQLRAVRVANLAVVADKAHVSDLLAQTLHQVLGDDAEPWTTYVGLGKQFDGTLGDLLDVCAGVHA